MNLLFSNHVKVGNKWLILLSGFNKNAVDKKGKKTYDYKTFNIPKEWRGIKWSKTVMIKQILAYCGLANSEGNLGVVDLEELAELLHCSIRSLRNNHKALVDSGLIEVDELYGNLAHIQLLNYQFNSIDLYEKSTLPNQKEEYGTYTGFTRIKKEVLFDMFKMKEVNLLRVTCRAIYQHEIEVHLGGNEAVVFDSHTLKGFLPTYFSYRPVIERALRKIGHLFDMQFFNVKEDKNLLFKKHKMVPSFVNKLKAPYLLSMKLHPTKDSRKIMEDDKEKGFALNRVGQVCRETGIDPISHKSIQEMVLEYGDDLVCLVFDEIESCYNYEYKEVSEVAMDCFNDIKSLRIVSEPIKVLRKIFRKYSLSFQEGYLFQF